ncbi:MAG: hypothetical protein Kow0098_29350 [Ignavibacteriaceae bacterium]
MNYESFYKKIRKDVKSWLDKNLGKQHRWADYILAAPDLFYLLTKLLTDKNVPANKKIKIAAAVAYFISPLDFIPEGLIGPVGYAEDVAIAAYVLNDLINEIDPQIVRNYWAGETDILDLIKTILANADQMIGSGIWKKIKSRF